MRANYTSYDVRRDEDIIRAGTHGQSNIMVLAPESADIRAAGHEGPHAFWYARVLGIYHANVIYVGDGNADYSPRRLEFLWVQWYELEDYDAGWSPRRLDRVSLPPVADEHSLGFLNPDDVLRSSHIIPLFREGLACEKGSGLSCCDLDHDHEDWKMYVINQCVLYDLSSVFRFLDPHTTGSPIGIWPCGITGDMEWDIHILIIFSNVTNLSMRFRRTSKWRIPRRGQQRVFGGVLLPWGARA